MARCVIDIETAPLATSDVPDALVEKLKSEAEAQEREDWDEKLGLYALGASVIVIGMMNPDKHRGVMLYDDRHGEIDQVQAPEGYSVSLVGGDEATLLREFWSKVPHYRPVITYNGRGFDIPFLLQRSLIRNVAIGCDLMPPRFSGGHVHLDLADLLSQYRATRPYGLEAWSQALGIASPKEGEVKGAEVGPAFHAGRTKEIVEYCLRDVVATAELSERVKHLWLDPTGKR